MDNLKKKLGSRIQEIRKSKKITQEKLAEMIGLDIPNISNIERGKKFVSSTTLENIINALNINPKELFTFEHIKSRNELIEELIQIINSSTDTELEYFYRLINLHKEYNTFKNKP